MDTEPQLSPKASRVAEAFFSKEWPSMPDHLHNLIMAYYGPEINRLEGVMPNQERQQYTSLLKNFYTLAFDRSFSRTIEYNNEKVEPIYFLTRSAWIDQIERQSGEDFANLEGIIMVDVANLSGANKVDKKNGDLLLAKTARGLEEALSKIEESYPDYLFIPCRYGGDEFFVAIIQKPGTNPTQKPNINQLLGQIKIEVETQRNLYWDEEKNQASKQNISLKPEATKVIQPPTEKIDRKIFFWALKRGTVLDQQEIKFFRKLFPDDQAVIAYLSENQSKSLFDKDNNGILFIMHDLINKHPELTGFLYLADVLDQQETRVEQSQEPVHRRLESLIRLVDKAINDRLLGDTVLSFEELKIHLQAGEFKEVLGIEMKFVKELNDHYSMALADEVIKALYQQLSLKISENEREKIQFFRRGGSFFIGIRDEISQETLSKLRRIGSFEIKEIFGQSLPELLDLPSAVVDWLEPEINKLDQFMTDMNNQWYENLALERPELRQALQEKTLPQVEITDPINQLTLKNLLSLFFSSKKRGKDRSQVFLEPTTELRKMTFEQIRKRVNWLKETLQGKLTQLQLDGDFADRELSRLCLLIEEIRDLSTVYGRFQNDSYWQQNANDADNIGWLTGDDYIEDLKKKNSQLGKKQADKGLTEEERQTMNKNEQKIRLATDLKIPGDLVEFIIQHQDQIKEKLKSIYKAQSAQSSLTPQERLILSTFGNNSNSI